VLVVGLALIWSLSVAEAVGPGGPRGDAFTVQAIYGGAWLGTGEAATSATVLANGQQVTCEEGSWLRLSCVDGSSLALGPGGRLRVLDGPGKQLRLETGRLRVIAAPQAAERPMRIQMPGLAVAVVGTIFECDAAAATVAVESGRVEVGNALATVAVEGGQMVDALSMQPRAWLAPRRNLIGSAQLSALSEGWDTAGEWRVDLVHDGRVDDESEVHALGSRGEQWLEYTFAAPQLLERVAVYQDAVGSYYLGSWRLSCFDGSTWHDAFAAKPARQEPGWDAVSLAGIVATRVRLFCSAPPDADIELYEFVCEGRPLE
jgi:hypothetical protein